VGWTELAKEAPGFRSCLAPTPATLAGLTIICDRIPNCVHLWWNSFFRHRGHETQTSDKTCCGRCSSDKLNFFTTDGHR